MSGAPERLELKPRQIEAAQLWLDSRAPNAPCPMCGARAWKLAPSLRALYLSEPDRLTREPGHGAPVVSLVCDHCAFVALFDAERIGVIELP